MTIATSGRGHQEVLNAEVFSWSELPELLAAEDLFDAVAGTGLDRLAVITEELDQYVTVGQRPEIEASSNHAPVSFANFSMASP